ncbi:lipid II:glycine glycyltransferase FemX [Halocatena pleomorpha]|uniref:GNAT family N-acetyltransferase n=1 Tax=Halocatena pleomorpha TaxID=1785090 RepID=A0A3P3REA5_9EURY|nr:GNAT family N-acetyltransferase [Halocatena pleomorpha]RRJ31826.1 GNAT family N-acetyltransferase [Halocatena pleomorpha]
MTETSTLTVRSVCPDRTPEWQTFVETHPDATVFHTAEWLHAIETVFGYEPRHVLLTDGGTVRALVPGFVVFEGFGWSVLNPFCEYGFPLIGEGTMDAAVLSALQRTDDTRVVKDVSWSGVSGYTTTDFGGVPTGSSIRLSIDRSFTVLWETVFDKDVRRCVRTARDHGVSVTDGTVDEFYPLYLETMRRLGSPQFPERFFASLADAFRESVAILLARHDGEPIAGVFLFEWGDATIIWTPASKRTHWDYRPNHLLYLEAIERACQANRSVVDFGRSRRGSSVHGFKAQFGGVGYPLMSFVTPPHRAGRASLDGYGRLSAVTPYLAPVITNPSVGTRLKRFIHE